MDYSKIGLNKNLRSIDSLSEVSSVEGIKKYIDSSIQDIVRPGGLNYSNIISSGREIKAVFSRSNAGGAFTNLQAAIDHVNKLGGGVVFIDSGTYTLSSNLTLYSDIHLIGEDRDTTILDLGNNNIEIQAIGDTAEYKEGTITVTNNSAVITGSGTVWLANVTTSDKILIDGVLYSIASVNTDTSITLETVYQGIGLATISYVTATFLTNILISQLTIRNANNTTAASKGLIRWEYIENSHIDNILTDNHDASSIGSDGMLLKRCTNCIVRNSESKRNSGSGINLDSGQSCIIDNCFIHDNEFNGITLNLSNGLGTKNFIRNCYIAQNDDNGIYTSSGKNVFIGNIIFRNVLDGIGLNNEENLVTGNIIEQNGSNGIELLGTTSNFNTIIGNYISFNTAAAINISDTGASKNVISSNNLRQNVATVFPFSSSALSEINYTDGNLGTSILLTRKYLICLNVSGGTLNEGDIVIINANTLGSSRITTTTIAGSNLVFGMVAETIANNDTGFIQVQGFTDSLKVDGTTDIAVGDFISCFTTAKIGKKAVAGDTAIAIAYEGYTTDDSNGIIDALIIPPRLI